MENKKNTHFSLSKMYQGEFDFLTNAFEEGERLFEQAKIVAAVNIKGGVGKSTIVGNILRLPNSIIVNLDEAQDPTQLNADIIETINFSEYKDRMDIITLIEALRDDYDYIILDTPGALNDDLLKAIPLIEYYIVPFTEGFRSISTTLNVTVSDINEILEGLESEGKISERKDKWVFVYNRYRNEIDFQIEKEKLTNFFKSILGERFKLLIGLKNSNVIRHLESNGKNIEDFYNQQPTYCYKFFGQASLFNKQLYRNFFNLKPKNNN